MSWKNLCSWLKRDIQEDAIGITEPILGVETHKTPLNKYACKKITRRENFWKIFTNSESRVKILSGHFSLVQDM